MKKFHALHPVFVACVFAVYVATGVVQLAAAAENEPASPEKATEDQIGVVADNEKRHTVITSKKLTYDKEKSFALFEEDVVVVDRQIKIMSSLLRVVFDGEDQIVMLEAEGNVRMAQDDRVATSERARYEVDEGKIVLDGNPVVRRGGHEISGDTITFWRNDNRMLVEPNARVKIVMEGEQNNMGFLGTARE